MFLYTEKTKSTSINVEMSNVDVFAVFGFNVKDNQTILNSLINITLQFPVVSGSLICIVCDIQVYNSSFIFIASGKQVSAIMIESQGICELVLTNIQFRFNSSQSSGLINVINSTLKEFSLIQCKIIGSNLLQNVNNGYISSSLLLNATLNITQLYICVNSTPQVGYIANATIKQLGSTPESRCDICQSGTVSYGICVDDLQFAQLKNGTLQCVYPFEYVNDQCQCAYGFMLNISVCIDLIKEISNRASTQDDQYSTIVQMQQNIASMISNQVIVNKNLDQSILSNATATNASIKQNVVILEQNIINNKTAFETRMTGINTTLITNITAQTTLIVPIQAQIDELMLKPACERSNDTTNQTDVNQNLTACDLPQYSTSFDITDITNNISTSDFGSGFVFSNNIQNAFINISNGVYNSVISPLFQTQNSFINLKIQIGTQITGTGAILTPAIQISITQVNILSAPNSNITVNSTHKLYILIKNATSTSSINNLMLNLTFAPSFGTIYLIGQIQCTFNLINYQILGSYTSTGQITLITPIANMSSVFIQNVSFTPSTFNPGNMSSYLISVSNNSVLNMSYISVSLGNTTNPQLVNQIGSTATYFYQFGGVLNQINSTKVILTDVMLNARQIFKVYYITSSGLILGRTNANNNSFVIERMCLSQALKSYTTFTQFGVIGFYEGIIQFSTSNVIMNVISSDTFNQFATLGATGVGCVYSNFYSLKISVIINGNGGSYIAALVGNNLSPNSSVTNSSIYSTVITNAYQYVGGYFGYCQLIIVIKYSNIINSNLKTNQAFAGGFIGLAYSNIQISNCTVQNITVGIYFQCGGIIGHLQAGSTMLFSNNVVTTSTISGVTHAGGFIGFADYSSNIVISEGILTSDSVTATSSNAGGFIGTFSQNYYACTLKIVTSRISYVKVTSPSNFGIAVGYKYPAFTVSTSILRGENYVNSVKISNCPNYAASC
ncbi:Hypothetical_protein [Hexamita inflata]|uniref:Hypothetical_protein n=1 Tax=Hexamita inflata TaxID=28002 RepID=A0AA86UXR4_9EUKA|nr:Hypothetical protein HINF_LOCUS56477 [Hexamita inflata]